MGSNNIFQLVQMMKNGGNPQSLILNMLKQQPGNPLNNNLLNLAMKGDTQGLMDIARNMCQAQGKDFDTEFAKFKNNLGL